MNFGICHCFPFDVDRLANSSRQLLRYERIAFVLLGHLFVVQDGSPYVSIIPKVESEQLSEGFDSRET